VSFCCRALALLAGVVACLAIYLLCSGGVAYKLATRDQLGETKFYKRTLEQFALLEAAQGRYDKVKDVFRRAET
jgi:hypothetical protein